MLTHLSILAKEVTREKTNSSENACAYVKKSRFHQCDDCALLIIDSRYALLGVFDGVSGQPHAREASETALRAIAGYVEKNFSKKNAQELLVSAIEDANYSIQNGGTTAAIALVLPDGSYSYANVGDSHI